MTDTSTPRDTPDDKLIRRQFCGYLDTFPHCPNDKNDITKGFYPLEIKIKVLAFKLYDIVSSCF